MRSGLPRSPARRRNTSTTCPDLKCKSTSSARLSRLKVPTMVNSRTTRSFTLTITSNRDFHPEWRNFGIQVQTTLMRHLFVVQAEVVAQLVDHRFAHFVDRFAAGAGDAVDRAAEDRDLVGHERHVAMRAFGQRDAAIDAEQLRGGLTVVFDGFEIFGGRFFLDRDDHVADHLGEPLRQRVQRLADDALELVAREIPAEVAPHQPSAFDAAAVSPGPSSSSLCQSWPSACAISARSIPAAMLVSITKNAVPTHRLHAPSSTWPSENPGTLTCATSSNAIVSDDVTNRKIAT